MTSRMLFYKMTAGEYSIVMDDVIKNADEALRIMIYINDKSTVYAKGNSIDGKAPFW